VRNPIGSTATSDTLATPRLLSVRPSQAGPGPLQTPNTSSTSSSGKLGQLRPRSMNFNPDLARAAAGRHSKVSQIWDPLRLSQPAFIIVMVMKLGRLWDPPQLFSTCNFVSSPGPAIPLRPNDQPAPIKFRTPAAAISAESPVPTLLTPGPPARHPGFHLPCSLSGSRAAHTLRGQQPGPLDTAQHLSVTC
jgi:hypothetical protein